jgi:hypothetical protein
MQPDEPNAEERLQELPQDNGTPFQPAPPAPDDATQTDQQVENARLDDTHQVTDTNIDPHELYDEGVSGAAEASEPNAGNAVVGYTEPDETGSLS